MNRPMSRRTVLSSLAAAPASMIVATYGVTGKAMAQAAAPAAVEAPKSSGSVDMAKLLQPGALPEKILGKEDAPITIVEYASMTCPHCANFHENTLPALKAKYIDTGKARLIIREFPFDPRSEAGFMLARCSKDNYFPMVDVLFKQQENWASVQNAKDALLQISKLAGFSQESFEACLTDQKLLDDVRSVQKRGASEFGVSATPTFFINGNTYKGALTIEEMSAILDGML